MFRCVISNADVGVVVVSNLAMPTFDSLKTCCITHSIKVKRVYALAGEDLELCYHWCWLLHRCVHVSWLI